MRHDRGQIDTNQPEPAWTVLAALLAPVKLVQRVLRRRRDRKEYERMMYILTRQGAGRDGVKFPKLGDVRDG